MGGGLRLERNVGGCVCGWAGGDVDSMLRVPHGWWYPETRGDLALAGAFVSSDAVLCADTDEFLDAEQGIPHFKGFPGRVVPCDAPEGMAAITLEG